MVLGKPYGWMTDLGREFVESSKYRLDSVLQMNKEISL